MFITSVFICDKDTLAVLDKFLILNMVNFQNYFANKLIECVIRFRSAAFQNTIAA